MFSVVSCCCSDNLKSPGAGLARSIPAFSPYSSSVCWQDHLVLLLSARFGLSCITMGQRTVWTSTSPWLPGTALPLALQRQQLSSPSCTLGCMATLGKCPPLTHIQTVNWRVLVFMAIQWPTRESVWSTSVCTQTLVSSYKAFCLHIYLAVGGNTWISMKAHSKKCQTEINNNSPRCVLNKYIWIRVLFECEMKKTEWMFLFRFSFTCLKTFFYKFDDLSIVKTNTNNVALGGTDRLPCILRWGRRSDHTATVSGMTQLE